MEKNKFILILNNLVFKKENSIQYICFKIYNLKIIIFNKIKI
jgi:hypothetical protein